MMKRIFVAIACAPLLSACMQEQQQPYGFGQPQGAQAYQAPQPQQMDEPRSLGLWKSSFGAVKIEEDLKGGAPGGGVLQGVWMYQRNGADVIGYFAGKLEGNVLQFTWSEPSTGAPLEGSGYIVFDQAGQRFAGRWWTTAKDRVGEWSGWRQGMDKPQAPPNPYQQGGNPYGQGSPYGGQGYGAYPTSAPPPPPPYPNSY
jgi:hypothetical protein